jgi:hypothetical protein
MSDQEAWKSLRSCVLWFRPTKLDFVDGWTANVQV